MSRLLRAASSIVAIGLFYTAILLLAIALVMTAGGSGGALVAPAVVGAIVAMIGRVRGVVSVWGLAWLGYVVLVLAVLSSRLLVSGQWDWMAVCLVVADFLVVVDLAGKAKAWRAGSHPSDR